MGWDLGRGEGGFGEGGMEPGEGGAWVCAFAYLCVCVFVRQRRVGALMGSETDDDGSDDELGGGFRSA
jgi:hypothetical protein